MCDESGGIVIGVWRQKVSLAAGGGCLRNLSIAHEMASVIQKLAAMLIIQQWALDVLGFRQIQLNSRATNLRVVVKNRLLALARQLLKVMSSL